MKLIKPSFEILEQGFSVNAIYKHIELCGRTCYKSNDKITKDSAKPFVDRMIKSGHDSILEHGTIYLKITCKNPDFGILCIFYGKNKYSVLNHSEDNKIYYITTNYRVLVENNRISDLKYLCEPTDIHEKRITVKFICNRQISHEFVRHRVFSFAQESTRYCNYTKDKFGKELTFIQPCWINEEYVSGDYSKSDEFIMFTEMLENIESTYNYMIYNGWKPQQAATILPNALKTELVMTGFIKDWKHFFNLRAIGTTGTPHPQAKELAEPLMKEFINRKYISYDTECMV